MKIILLDAVLSSIDFFAGPLFFVVLLMVFSVIINKYKDDRTRKLFLKAFYFKMFCTVVFSLIISYYYGGGDTEMYLHCTQDLKKAVDDNWNNWWKIYTTKVINVKTDLMDYFIFDGSRYPNFEAMHSVSNFLVPKLGLPIGMLTGMSYLSMAMGFSFYALGGAIRLYKFFFHYFPDYWREIALATLFLPSACFWSAGFLKDPICFGSIGFLIYGLFNIFIKKRKYISSLFWIGISVLLLFNIKAYILLALVPGIILWLFGEVNKVVENKTLKRIFGLMTFTAGIGVTIFIINYVSADESLQQYRLDTFVETSQYNRELYEGFSKTEEGAYYSIQTSNPALLILYGMIATLFRPFLWEISSPIVLLSAIESFFFLYITLLMMFKRGFFNFFKKIFSHPVFMMCFIFSIIFAAAVGSSATNFGSISRYKIPCLPFYLIMVLILYRQEGLKYPTWFNKLLGYHVTHKRFQKTAF